MKVFIIKSSGFAGVDDDGSYSSRGLSFTLIIKLDSNTQLTFAYSFAYSYTHTFIWKLESP